MITQQTQIKLTIPMKLKVQIEKKAAALGLPLSAYIRYKLIDDALYPTVQASKSTERAYRESMKPSYKKIAVEGNITDFLDKHTL